LKLSELIERLEEIRDERGDDADPEVYLAHQPHYPLAFTISGVTDEEDSDEGDEDEEADDEEEGDEKVAPKDRPVWICEGSHPSRRSPYAAKSLWDSAR